MEIKATDISARLLATENLSVVRANDQTASFDIVSRVLRIPLWKDMSPEIEDMLIAHEVGHALYTGMEYMAPIKEFPKLKSYMNVLEDVRIEKLIKRTYPGLRKRMSDGYKQLNERDFFGIKQMQSLDELLLIDKINLYYKAGFNCGVTFDAQEKVFVDRADKTETIDDVVQLAKEIYEYSLKKYKENLESISTDDIELGAGDTSDDETSDDEEFEFDEDYDSIEMVEDSEEMERKGRGSNLSEYGETDQDELESKTDSIMQRKLQDLADQDTVYNYWKFDDVYIRDVVVGYKQILSETLNDVDYLEHEIEENKKYGHIGDMTPHIKRAHKDRVEKYNKFITETVRTVNYLVKEFEMKKSAQLYKRARIAKTGALNLNKLYAYKLREDLFKQVTILPQGKNHGMVMLLDWSASMSNVLHDTLEQVISLASFCKRINIPYRVLAFSSSYFDERYRGEYIIKEHNDRLKDHANNVMESAHNILNSNTNFSLLEFFSSEMSNKEFNDMSRRLLTASIIRQKGYDLNSTPLNEALVWVYNNIGEYIKKYNIEKTTLITLTDGEGQTIRGFPGCKTTMSNRYYDNEKQKYITQKNLIRDDVTQKVYELTNNNACQTLMLLNMIKDRYAINTVGFHIVENDRRALHWALCSNLPNYEGSTSLLIDTWKKQFRNDGFALVHNSGRDELYMIPSSSTRIVEKKLEVTNDSTARSIAKSFGEFMNTKRTSRILLNRFINVVA